MRKSEKQITKEEIKQIILTELPGLIKKDRKMRETIYRLLQERFADKKQTEDRFEKILKEIQFQREESERKWAEWNKKWEETQAEWNKKWEENQKRWEENQKRWQQTQAEWNKKWEETQAEWNKKWEENQKRWEENQKRWQQTQAEWNKKWEETQAEWNKKWEENQKRWEENQKRWQQTQAEWNKKWEETQAEWNKKWEKTQAEWNKKWEKTQAEWNKKWEENQKKWEENQKRWEENQMVINSILEEIKLLHRKHDTTIGALGARWGLRAESSFREAIKGILEESFPIKVIKYCEKDKKGSVFGRPDQVELDLIIRDGEVIVAEIKSSFSKGDVATFLRKIDFYEKNEGKKVHRKIIISPMIESGAREFALSYGIEVYGYPEEIEFKELQSSN
ncbi:PD-(D/E)XK nuclease family protein [Thermodesulfovibrio sp. TK110]